jgi:hypothetical protein
MRLAPVVLMTVALACAGAGAQQPESRREAGAAAKTHQNHSARKDAQQHKPPTAVATADAQARQSWDSTPLAPDCHGQSARLIGYYLVVHLPGRSTEESSTLKGELSLMGRSDSGQDHQLAFDPEPRFLCPSDDDVRGNYPPLAVKAAANASPSILKAVFPNAEQRWTPLAVRANADLAPYVVTYGDTKTVRELMADYFTSLSGATNSPAPFGVIADADLLGSEPGDVTLVSPINHKEIRLPLFKDNGAPPNEDASASSARSDQPAAAAPAQRVTLRFSRADAPLLANVDLSSRIGSPSCNAEVARGPQPSEYVLNGCVRSADGRIWVRVEGFEPQRVAIEPNGVGALAELDLAATTALPELDGGGEPMPIHGRFAQLVANPPTGSHEVPACAGRVVVNAANLYRPKGLSVESGGCVGVVLPNRRAADGSMASYPAVEGCLNPTRARATGKCWVRRGPGAALSVTMSPGLKTFNLPLAASDRLDLSFASIAGRLTPRDILEGRSDALTPRGGAPSYKLASISAEAAGAPCRNRVAGAILHSFSLQDFGCPSMPAQLTYQFQQSPAPGAAPAVPPEAFEPALELKLDLESGNILFRGEPFNGSIQADEIKRSLPVVFDGDWRKAPFRDKSYYFVAAASGDCMDQQRVPLEKSTAGDQAPPEISSHTWPLTVALVGSDDSPLTACTAGKISGGRLAFNFESFIEPGPRTIVIWAPDERLNGLARREIVESLRQLMRRTDEVRKISGGRGHYGVYLAQNEIVEPLFSGESYLAAPDTVTRKLDDVSTSGGPVVPSFRNFERQLARAYSMPDIEKIILVMDGNSASQSSDDSSLSFTINTLTGNRTAKGGFTSAQVFTVGACEAWKLQFTHASCVDLTKREGVEALKAALANVVN